MGSLSFPSEPSFDSKWRNFHDEVTFWTGEHRKEDAFALIDTTLFGGGDEGILIDKYGITVRAMFCDGNGNGFISWEDFGRIGVAESSWLGTLTLCNSPKISMGGLGSRSDELAGLFARLLEIARSMDRKR